MTAGPAGLLRAALAIRGADLTFTWFASTWASFIVALARLAGKPSVVVLAGADVQRIPAIGYGSANTGWKRLLLRFTLRHATRLLPVDASLVDAARRIGQVRDGSVTVLPTGYDAAFWVPGEKDPGLVLTVAGCDNIQRLRVKGIDHLLAAATRLPHLRFVVIGTDPAVVAQVVPAVPPNVSLLRACPRQELLAWYQRAGVYCQPSLSEGLPNAVCEAMLCGCVPVGSAVGGMPTAIGDAGYLVPPGEPAALADAIGRAAGAPAGARTSARERIAAMFPLAGRRAALAAIVGEVRA